MSVLVCNPSSAPFAQAVGKTLWQSQLLEAFLTTVHYNPNLFWQRLIFGFSSKLEKRWKRRKIELPEEFVKQYPYKELLRIGSAYLDPTSCLTDRIWEWAEISFDRWCASQITQNTSCIYGYEHACADSFLKASELGVNCIYDVPAPDHEFTQNILEREFSKFESLDTAYARQIKRFRKRRSLRRKKEWDLASVVIANSEFTKNSFATSGLSTEKVVVIPYGAPNPHPESLTKITDNQKLKLVWAGTFSVRKGAHYLLTSWQQNQFQQHIDLDVYGALDLPKELVHASRLAGINFIGSVPRAQLYQAYLTADALIFPTLCDGFGMVITEALAHGLPVITTKAAGASSLITHETNGLVIEAGSSDTIANACDWCITHKSQLKKMRANAVESIKSWQWNDYHKKLIEIVSKYVS